MSAQVHTQHTLKLAHKIYMRPDVGWLRLEGQLAAKIQVQLIRFHLLTRQLGEHSSYYKAGKLIVLSTYQTNHKTHTHTHTHTHTSIFHTLSPVSPWWIEIVLWITVLHNFDWKYC